MMGTPHARMIKFARMIKTEDDLKRIISSVPKATALGFLEAVKDHLPFKVDFSSLESQPFAPDKAACL